MIDLNQTLEDFSNILDSELALKVLENKISDAFEIIDRSCVELYSDSDSLTNFVLFFFHKSIADFIEYYQISAEAYDYDEKEEDLDDGEEDIY